MENNWIFIKSEKDLPKDDIHYYYILDGKVVIGCGYQVRRYYELKRCNYYQSIIIPQMPINESIIK